ncbi:MAG TPA: alpha/beta hydrolase [Thermoanaerobaculia bacterium]|jgi:acetyl esterase
MTPTSGGEAPSLRGEDLDPRVREFVTRMGEGWARFPEFATASPPEARRIAEIVRAPWTRGGPVMASVTEHRVPDGAGGVRIRCYDPGPHGMKPAIVYLHGGGWTIFSLDTHDRLLRELAARSGSAVVGVDYALSPEAKYPVALDQVCAVLRHLAAHGRTLGIDPSRVAVAGDSAGGNLSVASCLRLRAAGAPLPSGMALFYGVFDRRTSPEAAARFGGPGYMLAEGEMEQFWKNYLTNESEADDPCVSPLRADLRGLPPALLVVPACDLLTEQSVEMARRLAAAGVDVRRSVYAGASHSFLEAVSISPLADRALADAAAWLRSVLTRGVP